VSRTKRWGARNFPLVGPGWRVRVYERSEFLKVVREILPFRFKLEVVHFYKDHRSLIFDAGNSRSRRDARKRGPAPHR
jgi:hypothetical protein